MINLKEIANKLSEILNSADNPLRIDSQRVAFLVATEGYRIDSISDRKLGKNLIPVFVGMSGGENNPIPKLMQQSKSVNIAIYYPIVYKDIFYQLEDYLDSVFVGKQLDIGTLSGRCLTNMGVATFGEIMKDNFNQFVSWTNNTYNKDIEITSNWFSMVFTLYATKLADGYMLGNDVSYKMEIETYDFYVNLLRVLVDDNEKTLNRYSSADVSGYCAWHDENGNTFYTKEDTRNLNLINNGSVNIYAKNQSNEMEVVGKLIESTLDKNTSSTQAFTEDLVWSQSGTGVSVSPISQQLINVDYATKNVANITSFNKSLVLYINSENDFGSVFMAIYNRQRLDLVKDMRVVKEYSNGFKYYYDQIALGINENITLGSPLSFTISLGDKK